MKAATAILLAVSLATAGATLALSAIGGHLTPGAAWLALAGGVAGAAIYWMTSGPAGTPVKMGWGEWAAVALFALFALRAFCWLVFINGDSISVLSPNNYGDLPMHLSYIRYFARGVTLWPDNPIFSGVRFHYPAGPDIFNALLEVVGCDDYRALIWAGLAASALACYALLRWGGWFVVMGFLCNGGLAGWKFFHHYGFKLEDYQEPMAWKSIPLACFVTQRGLLYAIPVGLLLLAVWRAQWFRSPEEKEPAVRMPLWVQVVLYGTMPLFHMHTFLWLSGILGWWVILGREGTRLRYQVLDLLLWCVLPATVCVSLVTGLFQRGQNSTSMLHLLPGWMQDGQEFFAFWFTNFGNLPLLALALLVWGTMRYRDDEEARNAFAFVFPSIVIFLVACVVMFAPWEWDNVKIMIWSYLAILPYVHQLLLRVPGGLGGPVRVVCYILLFFSGFISLAGGLGGTGYEIAKRSELEPVRFAVHLLPPGSTFAAWPTFNHPLVLCGCKVTEGYQGHLFSHGIDYAPRDKQLRAMMMGAPDWRAIAQQLRVSYLYWGPREAQGYPGSTQPWKNLPVVAAGNWGTLYDMGPVTGN